METSPPTPEPQEHGTFCANHPITPAEGACTHCGTFGCGQCLGMLEGRLVCRTCVEQGRVQVGLSPMDRRAELGLPRAVWQTLVGVCFRPGELFADMAPTGGIGPAFLFLALVAIPANLASSLWNFLSGFVTGPLLEPLIRDVYDPISPDLSDAVVQRSLRPGVLDLVSGALLGPVFVIIFAVFTALIVHLGLMMVGGARNGIEATLKGTLYSFGCVFLLVVPLLGGLWTIWVLVVLVFALMRLHGASGWQATFGVLWGPLAGCCCSVAAGFGLAMLFGAAL